MKSYTPTALMLGNIVTGCSVLAPAGMLTELASGLDVSIRDAGLLITFGAIMLCAGSPLTAWLTSRIERRTLLTATLLLLALTDLASASTGNTGWAHSAGIYPSMATSVAIWGLGFASTNSMQQVRLVAAAPALSSASVSLNTSVLYVGQAVGSRIGGLLYARELLYDTGYAAMGFVALALMTVILTRPRRAMLAAG